MALAEDVKNILDRVTRIEEQLSSLNGKSVWKAIWSLRVGLAVVYAVPGIVGVTWLVLKALGRL